MFTRVDHLMICVPDLERGVEQYRRMGFNVQPGGVHPGKGTHNAIAFNDEDYLELLAIRDPAEERAASAGAEELGRRPSRISSRRAAASATSSCRATTWRRTSPRCAPAAWTWATSLDGSRAQGGQMFRWRAARLGPKNPLPLFFIQHLTPMAERRKHTPGAGPHPNGVRFLERVYIVVNDLEASVADYAKVLGAPQPRMYKGTVIMSHMAVFQFGSAGLTIAHPYAPGPASDALERRGPGSVPGALPHHQHGRGGALDGGRTACRRRRSEHETRGRRRCWFRPRTRAAPISVS